MEERKTEKEIFIQCVLDFFPILYYGSFNTNRILPVPVRPTPSLTADQTNSKSNPSRPSRLFGKKNGSGGLLQDRRNAQ